MKRIALRLTALLTVCALVFLALGIGDSLAAAVTFGQIDQSGATSNSLSTIGGSQYTTTLPGLAESISAYLSFTPTAGYFGEKTEPPIISPFWNIGNEMAGQAFSAPTAPVVAQSISAYFTCDSQSHKVKAAIYDATGHFIVGSEEKSVSGTTVSLVTFELTAPTLLSPSTTYIIVAWSDASRNKCNLLYNTEDSNGRQAPTPYGTWPATRTFVSDSHHNFFIWCNYQTTANVQCAIYSAGGASQLGLTEQKTLTSSVEGWFSFNFETKPALAARTPYVLAAWSSDPNTELHYTGTVAPAFSGSETYPSWPSALDATLADCNYNLYCTMSANDFLVDFNYEPVPAHPGDPIKFTFTITNDELSVKPIQFITIQVPTGFSEPTDVQVSPPPGKNWNFQTSATAISLQKGNAQSNTLEPGESLTITFTAIAQAPILDEEWTVHALQGDNEFTLIGSQPTMSVIPVNVVPEYPLGALAALAACLAALLIYKRKSFRRLQLRTKKAAV